MNSVKELFEMADPVAAPTPVTLDRESRRMTVISGPASENESEATVTTDKPDYGPDETVIITGTGWDPGETVQLTIVRDRVPLDDGNTDTIIYNAVAAYIMS